MKPVRSSLFKITIAAAVAINIGCHAIDFTANPTCMQLKTAIEQAQPVEKIQALWAKILETENLAQESMGLAIHALVCAQNHKKSLEQQLAALGNKTYDGAKIKWGCFKILLISCVNGLQQYPASAYLAHLLAKYRISRTFYDKNHYSFDGIGFSDNFWINESYVIFPIGLAIEIGKLGVLCSGLWDLKQGYSFRQRLETNIKNVAKTIEFIQPYTDPAHDGSTREK